MPRHLLPISAFVLSLLGGTVGGAAVAVAQQAAPAAEPQQQEQQEKAQQTPSGKMGKDGPRDRPEFRGVELLDDATDRAVRVVEDPVIGTAVLIVEPGSSPQPVERAKCQRFDVTLRETGQLIMDVWGMEGSLDIDCPNMRGSVRFEQCYAGR